MKSFTKGLKRFGVSLGILTSIAFCGLEVYGISVVDSGWSAILIFVLLLVNLAITGGLIWYLGDEE